MISSGLRLVCVVCALLAPGFALDREAFTFTNYNLDVRIESDQQRLGVRGKITFRNDSNAPQKNVTLQISSTLDWKSIQFDGKLLPFISQTYTSDIDHTGALSEAIVTLPQPVAPKGTIELEIGYEGTLPLDATRLTRIGVPEKVAKHSDWDQIGKSFSAVRGVGYVVWYPVATESANLSEGDSVFETLGRWKAKEEQANFRAKLCTTDSYAVMNDSLRGAPAGSVAGPAKGDSFACAEHLFQPMQFIVPAFAMGDYGALTRPAVDIYYLPEHRSAADDYALAVELALPFITEWFGAPDEKAEVVDLVDAEAAPFESGRMLFMPLGVGDTKLTQTTAVHQLTHAAFPSPRPWIYEGVAHFAQAAGRERQSGRQAALDLMDTHRAAIIEAEKAVAPGVNAAADASLINTSNEEFYRSKAMYVWWMLRDMVGEPALKKALAAYRPEEDRDPTYVQKLISAQSSKDLEWFFNDWVYRDRGLPDFRVESVYPRATVDGRSIVTITVDNLGNAGAEVPVTLRFTGGEVTKRIEVKAKSKGVIRLEAASEPQEVVVNDGSVLESDLSNNIFEMNTK